jgi:hypothetical protein
VPGARACCEPSQQMCVRPLPLLLLRECAGSSAPAAQPRACAAMPWVPGSWPQWPCLHSCGGWCCRSTTARAPATPAAHTGGQVLCGVRPGARQPVPVRPAGRHLVSGPASRGGAARDTRASAGHQLCARWHAGVQLWARVCARLVRARGSPSTLAAAECGQHAHPHSCGLAWVSGGWKHAHTCARAPAPDHQQRKDWLALVAVHSDSWLLALAFYKGARLTKTQRCACRCCCCMSDCSTATARLATAACVPRVLQWGVCDAVGGVTHTVTHGHHTEFAAAAAAGAAAHDHTGRSCLRSSTACPRAMRWCQARPRTCRPTSHAGPAARSSSSGQR